MAAVITQAVGRVVDSARVAPQLNTAAQAAQEVFAQDAIVAQPTMSSTTLNALYGQDRYPRPSSNDILKIFLPLIIVMSTFLFLMLTFLCCVLLLRRRRGIALRDSDGPIDLSREDLLEGEGGFEGIEARWLESVDEGERREYLRAKEHQLQYPPNSQPTDITLSQFLSIQEKGVSAWSFEPDYETISSVLVHARTEITFLPDPASASCVQSNLPLPKLNEVYYWEIKLFDLPEGTNAAIGLATKPYPAFRLPGQSKYSVAYHSNGDKCFNWPFTASPFGQPLKEGDVLGVGYRPRSGSVFFTRNGLRVDGDAFVGLNRFNLFPTVGADGPCSVHVNLGQSGFVFIEANVKKWGLAPSVGTLAPPPAYGSERGSILLAAGGNTPPSGEIHITIAEPGTSQESRRSRRTHRSRRPKNLTDPNAPTAASPLRTSALATHEPQSPPPPITPIAEEADEAGGASSSSASTRYISPTDRPFHEPPNTRLPSSPSVIHPTIDEEPGEGAEEAGSDSEASSPSTSRSLTPVPPSPAEAGSSGADYFSMSRRRRAHSSASASAPYIPLSINVPHRSHGRSRSELVGLHAPPPESPSSPNPPTPNQRDIDLGVWNPRRAQGVSALSRTAAADVPPPSYSPLDPFAYAEGVRIDLPAEVISAAMEGQPLPASAIGQSNTRSDRRSRRHR